MLQDKLFNINGSEPSNAREGFLLDDSLDRVDDVDSDGLGAAQGGLQGVLMKNNVVTVLNVEFLQARDRDGLTVQLNMTHVKNLKSFD